MRWSRLSMQYRVTLSVAVGVAVILGVFGFFALAAMSDSRAAAEQDRLASARGVGAAVDVVVRRRGAELAEVAARAAAAWDAGTERRDEVLRLSSDVLGGGPLLLLAGTDVAWSSSGLAVPRADGPERATGSGGVRSGACRAGTREAVCVRAPVRGAGSAAELVLVIDPADGELTALLTGILGAAANAEIVGPSGAILAATAPAGEVTDHSQVLLPAIREGRPTVALHATANGHLVAYVPLDQVPGWGVAVEQPSEVALAVEDRLRGRLLVFVPLALAAAAVLAWLDVRAVVRPLRGLTRRATQMAAGDLTAAVAVSGQGEVRELATAFEEMRTRLRRSIAETRERDRRLEERVRERTEEVRRLYRALQEKEEARSRLLEAVMGAQEEERARVARELHDETAQSLAAAAMDLESAVDLLGPTSPELAERVDRARALARDSIGGIRRLIADLRPPSLDELGLVSAVRVLAEERLGRTGVRVALSSSGMERHLPGPVEIGLYRIIQEAISNVARHAHASRVSISLRRTDAEVQATVADDGVGFVVEERVRRGEGGRGLGLLGIQERAALLGGRAEIDASPGQGTRVAVRVPIAQEAG